MYRLTGAETKSLLEAYNDVYSQGNLIEGPYDSQSDRYQSNANSAIQSGRNVSISRRLFGQGGEVGVSVINRDQTAKSGRTTLNVSPTTQRGISDFNNQITLGGNTYNLERLNGKPVYVSDKRNPPSQTPTAPRPQTPAAPRPQTPAAPRPQTPAASRPPASSAGRTTPKPQTPVLSKKNGVEGTGVGKDFVAKQWSDTERQRYTTRLAQNQRTAPTPTNSSSSTAPRPPAPSAGRTTPTPSTGPKISQDDADLQRMRSASIMRQNNMPLPGAANPTGDDIKKSQTASNSRKLTSSFDIFDVVIGHLLDEGYANTEESAITIMANMSGEWRESIIESMVSKERLQQLRQQLGAPPEQPKRKTDLTKPLPKDVLTTSPQP